MIRQIGFYLLQPIVLLLIAPFVNGIVKKIKALSQKRKGPPLGQLYYDLLKLFHKGTVTSETASWIFRATPYVFFGTTVVAAWLVPGVLPWGPMGRGGDLILFVGILALGRFFMTLAGLDTASTFGGMGSSREMMVATVFEPALLVSLLTAALIAGDTSLSKIAIFTSHLGVGIFQPAFILGFAALFFILIAETARIPVDDPATHLELTMIHEAMLLEYSGPPLALMEWGASLKQLLIITVLVNVILPVDQFLGWGGGLAGFLLYLAKVIVIAVGVGVFEINMVKLRLFSIPNIAALSFILAFLGFFQYFVLGR